MALKFSTLTRTNVRKLEIGQKINEHGIYFTRLANGDGKYSVNVMVDGVRIHRVIGNESEGVTREQAEQYIEQLRTDARQDRLNLPKGRKTAMSFKDAATEYLVKLEQEGGKDIKDKIRRLNQHLVPYFGNLPLAKICTSDVDKYKQHRLLQVSLHGGDKVSKSEQQSGALTKPVAPGTVNRELATLSHLFTKAVEWGWLSSKLAQVKKLKEDNARITYLTKDQIDRVLQVAINDQNKDVYLFILIGLETSMRKMEILSIRIEDIDLKKRTIFIPKAKAGAREQPITIHLADYLMNHLQFVQPNQKWLFSSELSSTGHVVNIEKAFRRVIIGAGLNPKEVVRHTLRHTAITHLVQAGVDLPTVQRISGHKTLQMVSRYSHQNGEHIREAMDKLDQRYRTREGKT